MKFSCPCRLMPLLLLLSLLLLNGVPYAIAVDAPPAYQPDLEYYLKKVGDIKTQGFLKEEIRKFRSYPHLDRAYRLQREQRPNEARQEFEAYLALAPEDIRSRVSYLVMLDKMSLNDEVIAQADLILSRWPAFVPGYFFKGLAFQKQGKRDRAFAVFSTAARENDMQKRDRTFALTTAADLALALQNYEDAGRMLQAITEIEHNHAWYMKTGFVFLKSGKLKESLAAYIAARDYAKTPAEKVSASLALAEVAKKQNNMELARLSFEKVVDIDSSSQAALRGLANLAYLGKRYDEAEKWLLLLKRNDTRPEDREFLANLYLKRDDYAAAIKELKAMLEQQGKRPSPGTMTLLAQTYESAGRYQESAATYKLLLASVPESGELLSRYGNLLIGLENFKDAGPFLTKALSGELTVRQRADARINLALIYEKSGDYEKAAEELEKCLLDQSQPGGDLLVRLALLLNRAGKADEALHYLDRAAEDRNMPDDLKRLSCREKSAIFEKSGNSLLAAVELEKSLKPGLKDDSETSVRLAVLLNKAGRSDESLRYLTRALSEPSLAADIKRVALREKGLILEKSGNRHDAALEYEKAMALGDGSPGIHLILANLYLTGDYPEKAISYLNKVIEHHDATNGDKCSAEDALGQYLFNQSRMQEATGHFTAALRLCGENWERRYYLGLAHYRSKQWAQALEQFLRADGYKRNPASLLGIALCQKELNRPGAAVHYLLMALQESVASPAQLKLINDTLGHLYAEEYAYGKAVEAFTRSLAQTPDQVITLKLANILNLDNKTDAAWKTLSNVDPNGLTSEETIEYNDLKSGLLQKMGRYEEALALMEKNQRLQATTFRSHALGMLCQSAGQLQKAVAYFQVAYDNEPQQDDYAKSLAYAYVADERFSDAIGIFEIVAARNSNSVKILEQLGYLNVKTGNNDRAVQWFKQALDGFPVMPLGSSEEKELLEKDAQRIRSEISKLSKRFNLLLYASYRAGKAPNSFLASGEQFGGGVNGQVGIETSFRPPVIGLQNDRILQLFGRVFGNLKPNSLNYNDDSTQAGIGLRYKFLQKYNLWISGEKLFKVGKDALDDWLLRLLYSLGTGFEPLPREHNQDYYLLYGEVDGYLRSESVAAYGEVRKGRAFTLRSNQMLIPHLVLGARWQTPFDAGGNYLEGGAGISLKYFFNSSNYENFRDVIDLSITFRHGMFFSQGYRDKVGDYNSTLLSLGLFF